MYKKLFLLLALTQFTLFGIGQNITVNYDLDTTVHDVAAPLNLWINFLETADDAAGSVYWNSREVDKYGTESYFLIENELDFGMDNYLKLLSLVQIKVLSIRKSNEYFKITSMLSFSQEGGGSEVQYIFHVYAGPDKGELKLFNPLEINDKIYLKQTTLGSINFHYPKSHQFNPVLAQKQVDFLSLFANQFGAEVGTIDYYFASTAEEMNRIKGFDYLVGYSGEEIPFGKADVEKRIVYAVGLGEYYPHEFIHILLNPMFPDAHLWINEGVAAYFGMSRGYEYKWHLKKLHHYLLEHSEVDLANMLELRTLDKYTDFRYVLGGLFAEVALEKGGIPLIKKLLEGGSSDEDFYAVIEEQLGIERGDLNTWIRARLEKEFGEG